jgi:predicted Zn-dependent protease
MKKSLVVSGLVAAMLLAGCQSVNTTSGGAVGVERKQYMFSMLSSQEVDQMYAQSYQQTLGEASSKGQLDKTSADQKLYNGAGEMALISSNGRLVAYTKDASKLGEKASDLLDSNELTNLNQLKAGEVRYDIDKEHGHIELFLPFTIGQADARWTLMLQLPLSAVMADSQKLQSDLEAQRKTDIFGMTLPNSRSNENEADLIGLELSARAGYNPNAAITLWNKMAKASEGAPPEFMSTHPASDSRIASLQAAIPKVMPLYQQAKKS